MFWKSERREKRGVDFVHAGRSLLPPGLRMSWWCGQGVGSILNTAWVSLCGKRNLVTGYFLWPLLDMSCLRPVLILICCEIPFHTSAGVSRLEVQSAHQSCLNGEVDVFTLAWVNSDRS